MTYAIGEIVYGVNLGKPWGQDIVTPDQRKAIEEAVEANLVTTCYSGNGEQPCFVGPVLSNIDECTDVEISDLVLVPTAEQMCRFVSDAADLVSEFPILDDLFENPTVFITWGSS